MLSAKSERLALVFLQSNHLRMANLVVVQLIDVLSPLSLIVISSYFLLPQSPCIRDAQRCCATFVSFSAVLLDITHSCVAFLSLFERKPTVFLLFLLFSPTLGYFFVPRLSFSQCCNFSGGFTFSCARLIHVCPYFFREVPECIFFLDFL